jgi:hypothetical protein
MRADPEPEAESEAAGATAEAGDAESLGCPLPAEHTSALLKFVLGLIEVPASCRGWRVWRLRASAGA